MLIYVNGRFLTKTVTGVARYALETMRQFDALLDREEYAGIQITCLTPPEPIKPPGWKNIQVRSVGINRQNLWEQTDLLFHARGYTLFSPGNSGPILHPGQVATIHDASVFAYPQAYTAAFRLKYHLILRALARRARLILTVSQFSRRELTGYLRIRGERLKVIYNGGNHLDHATADERILENNHLPDGKYLLTVFSDSPHKNFACVADAAGKVRTKGLQFIGVGGTFPRIFQSTRLADMPPNVRLAGYANDRELKALYEHAAAFIFPSFYEGFGFPVLEAMRSGCPVICANTSSLPEVAGDATLYFDPHKPDELADQIDLLMVDRALREAFIARGIEQSSKFRWESSARETLDSLVQAARAGPG